MPRQKPTAPTRLTENEQRSSTWRMGDPAPSPPDDNAAIVIPDDDANTGTSREYTVIFDDDDEGNPEYISSDDDDYSPPQRATANKPAKTKKSKKKSVEESKGRIASELEDLVEDSQFHLEVRKELVSTRCGKASALREEEGEWWSSIAKLEISLDLDRYQAAGKVILPDRPLFWVYLSPVPGRSFLYYEWFERKPSETDKRFEQRKKLETADNVHYFYIKDIIDRRIVDAFSVKQKVLQLKLHKYYDFTGKLELKVCITSDSLIKLTHPSDYHVRTPQPVRIALATCFNVELVELAGERNLNHDIDQLFSQVKKYHRGRRGEREEEVKVDPQHRSLLPTLRPYQADAVRWMLLQENYQRNLDEDLNNTSESVHVLYEQVTTHDGTVLYLNKHAGYLVREKPLARESPPGGILADEMGLGKTVEVLSCMLNNPRQNVVKPGYLEPIIVENRRKKRKRIRSPSPIEFYIKDSEEEEREEIDSAILRLETDISAGKGDEEGSTTGLGKVTDSDLGKRSGCSDLDQDADSLTDIDQVDGGLDLTSDDDEEEEEEVDDDDDDFVLPASSSSGRGQRKSSGRAAPVKRPDRADRTARSCLNRKYSDKRTVYFHEDFDSESSEEEVIPKPKKRKKVTPRPASIKPATKKGPKVINTNKPVTDSQFPVFQPFRNGKVPDKNSKLPDIVVKCLHDLGQDVKNRNGISIIQLKQYLKREYGKDCSNSKTKEKFTQAINEGVERGQFVKTSLGGGATGSVVLNPHYNPDDSRAAGQRGQEQGDKCDTVMEAVITEKCYAGTPFSPPHIPARFAALLQEKKKSRVGAGDGEGNKGKLYEKLKSVYEMSLPMSLASYASDNSSRQWNRSYFTTKVEQRAYFECVCGSTEEDRRRRNSPGYRVQCNKCGTEQHAECMKYDITDPYRGEYICPHCWVQSSKVQSGATLIVSPSSISFQWIEEIQKHVRHREIRMYYYKGAKEMGYIQPQVLSSYDIVITTYEVLAQETNYVDLPHSNSSEGRRFRNPKRFMAMPSPLTCIQWWRICLDEAQLIESTATKTAEMALRLSGVNRWCVTGTPVGKSVQDLYGLLLFLQVDPYLVETWWRDCVYLPYCHGQAGALESLLSRWLWRTCKKDVVDQIDIPPQREETHWLQFSPVEEHFYRRQHIDISRDMIGCLRRYAPTTRLSSLDRQSISTLLVPLLRLRQGCCHPQAVRGQFMSLQKTTLTMEQLLEQLIKKAVLETEESHRQYVAALNGLAGLDIIETKWSSAAETYREVLRSVEEHLGKIKTDTLQKLHTVTNLAEIIEAGHPGIAPTLRDSQLRTEAGQLRERYMSKYHGGVEGAWEAVEPVTQQVEEFHRGFTGDSLWYEEVINWVNRADQEHQLMKLVHDELAQFFDVVNEREFREIQAKYPSSRIVMYKVSEKLEEVERMRNLVLTDMKELRNSDPEKFLNGAVDCHLRVSTQAQKNKKKCRLCQVHDNIELYENTVFHFIKGEIKGSRGPDRASVTAEERKVLEDSGVFLHDEQKRGTWSDSEAERLCRAVLKYARNLRGMSPAAGEAVLTRAANQMRWLELVKKEFRLTRIHWRQMFDRVAGVDELNMSTLRLRLRYEDEPVPSSAAMTSSVKQNKKQAGADLSTRVKEKVETIYILERHELDSQRLKLIADKTTSLSEMKKKLGQLLYLENLQRTDYGKRGGHNPEPCPICQKELGAQWSVLQCGHCYCVECIRVLISEFTTGRSTKCAVCRSLTNHQEISYVSTRRTEEADSYRVEEIKGSHSTKVEAVVKTLVHINSTDPCAKSLVFSTWSDVLDIIAAALDENDIPYAALHGGNSTVKSRYKRNIQKFKNRGDVKVLLMPVSRGANGLNLVEASHVLLVEPILNPAQELQAVGRIHRIGQKKSTVVHRFLVRQTIEERIHQMMKNYHRHHTDEEIGSHTAEENLLSIQDLRNLFVDEAPMDITEQSAEEKHDEDSPSGSNTATEASSSAVTTETTDREENSEEDLNAALAELVDQEEGGGDDGENEGDSD